MKNKKNIVLCDCDYEEIRDLLVGLENGTGEKFEYASKELINHGLIQNMKRYLYYFIFPIKFALHHKQYNYVIGWQQFFALTYVAVCRLLHFSVENKVIALNFTYKEKKGLVGKIYKKFMQFCVQSKCLAYIHVPSNNYVKVCSHQLNVEEEKFIVTPFGLPDTYGKWKNTNVEYENYSFSIGRSNRDFRFLVDAWRKMPKEEVLVIASDSFQPSNELPSNVIHRKDISGDLQFPYIANCKLMIIPIDDGNICSGDTVLLKAMSYCKPVVVTFPSTLAEMYIEDGVDGILTRKDNEEFVNKAKEAMNNKESLGLNARKKYMDNFSRKSMGERIGKRI